MNRLSAHCAGTSLGQAQAHLRASPIKHRGITLAQSAAGPRYVPAKYHEALHHGCPGAVLLALRIAAGLLRRPCRARVWTAFAYRNMHSPHPPTARRRTSSTHLRRLPSSAGSGASRAISALCCLRSDCGRTCRGAESEARGQSTRFYSPRTTCLIGVGRFTRFSRRAPSRKS